MNDHVNRTMAGILNTVMPKESRPGDGIVRPPGLYRAQLLCKIGRGVLVGKTKCPDGVQPIEWAMFNLLHAVEEIATAMKPNAPDEVAMKGGKSRRKGG